MAIDTAAKRNSSLDHEEVWQWGTPVPDGAIGQGDRQHSIWSYSGILAGAASLVAEQFLHYTAPRRLPDFTPLKRVPDYTSKDRKPDYAPPPR